MMEEQKSKLYYLGIIPKCPHYKSAINMGLIIALMALGTVGIYFFNVWVAVGFAIYAVVFYLWLNPVKVCPDCYYNVTKTTIENGKTCAMLLPLDEWKESYLQKYIDCGKKWSFSFILLWIGPIVFMVISFFVNWNIIALLALICYVTVMVVWNIHLKRRVCPTCAIQEECHAAF